MVAVLGVSAQTSSRLPRGLALPPVLYALGNYLNLLLRLSLSHNVVVCEKGDANIYPRGLLGR